MNNSRNSGHFSSPLLEVADLTKDYHDGRGVIPILHGINLEIWPGEMAALIGPSGSGKSTLLFILGLFLSPTQGSYRFAGQDVLSLSRSSQAEFRRRRVGFVFQSSDLLENSTVYENLEFPLIYSETKRGRRKDSIHEALEMVNLGHRSHHLSNRLSGGERQRVAVARALVNHPQAILADEPTGQLDRDNSRVIMEHFEKISRTSATAVIVVTHDLDIAAWCQRIYRLEDGLIKEDRT
ncbi:MAG: ABC transporter ATP-binding protein [Pseudomonadota bacterium]